VPGLLSFRETPALAGAFESLSTAPDLLMADGHGYAHPRRFGFACHLGLLLDVPTIGVAKSRLIGAHGTVGEAVGSRADLVDHEEVIGSLLRTRERVRPIFVSIGHRIELQAAERWAVACARGYRVPAPTRLADRLSRIAKQRMLDLTLPIVIEQRAGEHGRWEWVADDDDVVFRHELPPMPVHYGCSIDLLNKADAELLDVMLVDDREYARGAKLEVRVIDVLERADGDHKMLALPLDHEPYAAGTGRRIAEERERIWRWYVETGKPVLRWGGEEAALELINQCRTHTMRNGDTR
jgi:inorganic pyrophosphatase